MRQTIFGAIGALFLVLACSGCVAKDYVLTTQDPTRIPRKTDPVYVLTQADAPDVDPKLQHLLQREVQNGHFNVVSDINLATWVLGVSHRIRAFGTQLPPSKLGTFNDPDAIHVYLFPAPQFRNGLRDPAWQGVVIAENTKPGPYTAEMLHDIMAVYGGNYENDHLLVFNSGAD